MSFLISALAAVALAQSNPPAQRAARHSIEWQQVPLGDAVRRLNAVSTVDVVLDRRVDPSQRIDLSLPQATADEIAARIAATCSLGYARLPRLIYLGPSRSAARLKSLVAVRRREVSSLAPEDRATLLAARRIAWPQLTQPRSLVVQLVGDQGWRVEHDERIPHDLWPAGELPPMPLAEQLTLLLAGFDRSYRVIPGSHAVEIIPIDWEQIPSEAIPAARGDSQDKPEAAGRQVFSLRVENQPVGKILDQLARRLAWKLTVDEPALRAAGRSLDTQVSFAVTQADEEQLLEALLAPAGLRAVRKGKEVSVGPR